MLRLDIDVTDPNDLPYIYDRLRALPAPSRLHALAGDLVTGIFPLPQITADRVLVPTDLGGELVAEVSSEVVVPLGWGGALDLSGRARLGAASASPNTAHEQLVAWSDAAGVRPEAHVAVVASCEGEAVLIAEWVDRRRAELGTALGVRVSSRSWLAVDVAPVGTLVCGELARAAVAAPNWIVVTQSIRQEHCSVTAALATTARRAGRAVAWVFLDQDGQAILETDFPTLRSRPTEARDEASEIRLAAGLRPILGGVYRRDLVDYLRSDLSA